MRTDPRFNKWCFWLQTIERDVSMLLLYRRIFSETKNIVEKNQRIDLNHPFFSFFLITYMDSSVMGIRRQLKNQQDSISLKRLLIEIADNPQLVTRSDHYELYNGYSERVDSSIIDKLRQQTFDKFALPDSSIIDVDRVRSDLEELKKTCNEAETFADRRVAHWDKREHPVDLNLDTIFRALDALERLIKRYHLLFFAQGIFLTPGLPSPISDVFREPWVVPSSE